MKLRPVLLVLVILSVFYYLSTRLWPSGALASLVHHGALSTNATVTNALSGPLGSFSLTEAAAAPEFDSEEQQNIAVYKRGMPSVVNITSVQVACCDFFLRPVPEEGQGSGFIIDKDGHILTNNHVIEGAQTVEVTLSNKKKYKAAVVGVDSNHDLALLQIKGVPDLQPAVLADSKNLMVGQKVYAIGNPFGFNGTMTSGIISAIRSVAMPSGNKIEDAIQTDASVNPGNSGGPLLNSRGEVIGVTTMIASNPNGGAEQSAGIGFAIPMSTAKAVLEDFAKYGRARRPSLDIVTLPIGPDIAEQIGLPADNGILIERVLPGGAAEAAGLRGGMQRALMGNTVVMLGGDLIVGFDGQAIETPQDLSAAMNSHRAGDVVTLTVFRGRQKLSVKVTLSEARQVLNGRNT
ncbi:serine protease, S1-C subfamily, contains C-terminal PDZ domain [Bryocella elongata]|uniref:Serine protease, S1-C subfamily, contains C-terminal PDZ domain n=1 Tax=Bryocella elongata TaxID=863522 RepID=A0A1H6AA54_9BACT|nr:trypsin-like peptidase domain-containing protein [Bryocella elongata]SEG45321.1 serine protease, S1-C subfamily, contains C-terminal PDZ domain [Bryocella elongata]